MTIGRVIAAFLLPPLAVFLAEGISLDFWIAVVLTCLGYVPGIVFAFFILAKRSAAERSTA